MTTAPKSHSTLTFAAHEQRTKDLSDSFIVDALGDQLMLGPDERVFGVKSYLDKVPADASDEAFGSSERAVIGYRNGLSDFIARNLSVHVANATPAVTGTLKTAKDAYIAKLRSDKQRVADWIHGWRVGGKPAIPRDAYDFRGFTFTHNGTTVDLSGKHFTDVRPNIYGPARPCGAVYTLVVRELRACKITWPTA